MFAIWNTCLNYLFTKPGTAALPGSCYTLAFSPPIRELMERFIHEGADYVADSHAGRLAQVAPDELVTIPAQRLNLPVSAHPKIRAMTNQLVSHPDDRSTLSA